MIIKAYAAIDKDRKPIWAWPKDKGRDWIAGKVVECEIVLPDNIGGTTVSSAVQNARKNE